MTLGQDRKTILTARSDRVKSLDFHSTQPWLLTSLYSGNVCIWNYQTQSMVKSFDVCDLPVRTAKFIERKNWIVAGSDTNEITVYNFNTMEKIRQFEGHYDYIRDFCIHPSKPWILSCSDDLTIKLWDWDNNWKCLRTFEGHSHYVMSLALNPKDESVFATASLDRTIKVWNINSSTANFTLEGHKKGVCCLAYSPAKDRPYLLSGGDDFTVRIWDYQTKSCIRILEGHTNNVESIIIHPSMPLIFSGAEDSNVKIWNGNTFQLETSFNPLIDRIWKIALLPLSNLVAIGGDSGTVVMSMGSMQPSASMDENGKLIWSKQNDIFTLNLKAAAMEGEFVDSDGQILRIAGKDLGNCDFYPQSIKHCPGGRFVSVCGDGQFIIYSTLGWRNKTFGKGKEVCWSSVGTDFAVRQGGNSVIIYKNFEMNGSVKLASSCDAIFGGHLLGAYSEMDNQISFFDWNTLELVRRIDVDAKHVCWSEDATLLCIASETSLYTLAFDQELYDLRSEKEQLEDENIFSLIDEFEDVKVSSGIWSDGCFFFTNSKNRKLCYLSGGQKNIISSCERELYVQRYLSENNIVICIDKDCSIIPFHLDQNFIAFQRAVIGGDQDLASALKSEIHEKDINKAALFLEGQGRDAEALAISTDCEYKFRLAIKLKLIDVALSLVKSNASSFKWRQLGDLALSLGNLQLAESCYEESEDFSSLLILFSANGKNEKLYDLGKLAARKGQLNIAFSCFFACGNVRECLKLLCRSERYPEAVMFCKTYIPIELEATLGLWRGRLESVKHRAKDLLACPSSYPDLFPKFEASLQEFSNIKPGKGESIDRFPSANPAVEKTVFGDDEVSSLTYSRKYSLPISEPISNASSSNNFEKSFQSPHDAISDQMSMEVNTGTHVEDIDDLASVTFSTENDPLPTTRAFENLSIQELPEEVHSNSQIHLTEDIPPSYDSDLDDDGVQSAHDSDISEKDNNSETGAEEQVSAFEKPPTDIIDNFTLIKSRDSEREHADPHRSSPTQYNHCKEEDRGSDDIIKADTFATPTDPKDSFEDVHEFDDPIDPNCVITSAGEDGGSGDAPPEVVAPKNNQHNNGKASGAENKIIPKEEEIFFDDQEGWN